MWPFRHVHKWIKTGFFKLEHYAPAGDGVMPAQELFGRKIHWRSCRCGHVEEYFPSVRKPLCPKCQIVHRHGPADCRMGPPRPARPPIHQPHG